MTQNCFSYLFPSTVGFDFISLASPYHANTNLIDRVPGHCAPPVNTSACSNQTLRRSLRGYFSLLEYWSRALMEGSWHNVLKAHCSSRLQTGALYV